MVQTLLTSVMVYIRNMFKHTWRFKISKVVRQICATVSSCSLTTALQQPLHPQWDPVPSGPRSRRRTAALGGEARPVAEETQAGWSYKQSTSGFLSKGLEDPAEVPRPVHRWIRVAVVYHERGSISQTKAGFRTSSVCVCLTLCFLCR